MFFSFGAMSEPRTSLIGTTQFEAGKGTVFKPSRFVDGIQQPGAVILLDELNRCDRDAYNLLIPLLDGQRYLSLDEASSAPVIHVADNVCFIATANIGSLAEYSGTRALDSALRDRFHTQIPLGFPPKDAEFSLIERKYPRLPPLDLGQLLIIATKQRQMWAEGEFEFGISTRMLIACAEQLHFGTPIRDAITFCLSNHFSDAGGTMSDRTRFRQLCSQFLRI